MKIRRVIELKWSMVRSQGGKGPRVQEKIPKNNHLNPRTLEPWNPNGFTLIEVILVTLVIAILAAVIIPRVGFDTAGSASVEGAAQMVASDIRYTQECAISTRTSKTITFPGGNSYSFSHSNNLDPSGRLPAGVTTSALTLTFNSLGEPIAGGGGSLTVSGSGGTKTINIANYTGKVSIL